MSASPVTIRAELRLPQPFMVDREMDDIEAQLEDEGLLPVEATERRWRMDSERPGGYILTYTFSLVPLP